MRGRTFNWRAIGAAALYALVAITVIAAAIDAAVGYARAQPTESAGRRSRDAATRELRLCQSLGVAAERDPDCRAAWTANRDHFLDERTGGSPPISSRPRS